jgi:L-threonylcarbamoyladenylate synthase
LAIDDACLALRRGEAVAFPTPCGYGFAVDPFHGNADQCLNALKPDRSAPVGLIVADRVQADAVVARWSPEALRFAQAWPAALTLVLPARSGLPACMVSRVGGVALRIPESGPARALAAAYGGPLTATSLNRSGEPTARSVGNLELYADLLAGYLAGPVSDGLPSTLVDLLVAPPQILRQGAVRIEAPWG